MNTAENFRFIVRSIEIRTDTVYGEFPRHAEEYYEHFIRPLSIYAGTGVRVHDVTIGSHRYRYVMQGVYEVTYPYTAKLILLEDPSMRGDMRYMKAESKLRKRILSGDVLDIIINFERPKGFWRRIFYFSDIDLTQNERNFGGIVTNIELYISPNSIESSLSDVRDDRYKALEVRVRQLSQLLGPLGPPHPYVERLSATKTQLQDAISKAKDSSLRSWLSQEEERLSQLIDRCNAVF